jgi:hypothetical protein
MRHILRRHTAKVFTSDDTKSRCCKRLGRISFREDQRATMPFPCSGFARIVQFHVAGQSGTFAPARLCHGLLSFEFGIVENVINHAALEY